jgi:hypothetical protein
MTGAFAVGRATVGAALLALVVGALVCAGRASAQPVPGMWSVPTTLSRIDGALVQIGRWRGRIRAASPLCSGEGRGVSWSGTRHWRRFTCTWTVFDRRGGIDRDITFGVRVLGTRRFVIANARFGAS